MWVLMKIIPLRTFQFIVERKSSCSLAAGHDIRQHHRVRHLELLKSKTIRVSLSVSLVMLLL